MTYRRRRDATDLAFTLQAGPTLTNWSWMVTEVETNPINLTLEEVVAFVTTPANASEQMFTRLLVTRGPLTKAADVFAVRRLVLPPGRHYLGVRGDPATNTIGGVLGTNRFVAGDTEASATVVDFWDQTTQLLTGRVWLSNAEGYGGWREAGSFADANGRPIDIDKGFILTVREAHGLTTNYLCGRVPRAPRVQTVQNNGYTLVAASFPVAVGLDQTGLVASGFEGGTSLATSDRVLFFNPQTQLFDEKVWFDSAGRVWRDHTGALAKHQLEPATGLLIYRRPRPAGHLVWTNPLPYQLQDVWP